MWKSIRLFLTGSLAGMLVVAPIEAAASSVTAAALPSLEPISPWEMLPGEGKCTVARSYRASDGPIFLSFHESVSGRSFQLAVEASAKGVSPIVGEYRGRVEIPGGAIERWGLNSVGDNGASVESIGLSPAEMSRIAAADTMTVRMDGSPDRTFDVTGVAEAVGQLGSCTAKVRHEWHVDGKSEKGITYARGDVRSILAQGIAQWTLRNLRSGTVQFILLIDESGKAAECDLEEPSGAPLVEAVGCQLLRREAKFQPARDKSGKAVKDSLVTPMVVLK